MHSIEALLGMVRTDAVMNGGMTEDQVRRYGSPERSYESKLSEQESISFGIYLVGSPDGECRLVDVCKTK